MFKLLYEMLLLYKGIATTPITKSSQILLILGPS